MCYTPADGVPGLSVSSCDRHVVEDRVTVALVGLSVMTWRSERSERHNIDLFSAVFRCSKENTALPQAGRSASLT